MKICSASMSSFSTHVTPKSKSSSWRGSPRESQWSGKATTREATTPPARPGHRITRLAVIFVHSFSQNMRNRNRTAELGRRVPDHVQVQLTRHDLKHERKSTEDGVTHEFTGAEL